MTIGIDGGLQVQALGVLNTDEKRLDDFKELKDGFEKYLADHGTSGDVVDRLHELNL